MTHGRGTPTSGSEAPRPTMTPEGRAWSYSSARTKRSRLHVKLAASTASQRNLFSMPYRISIPKSGPSPDTASLLQDLGNPARADRAATLADREAEVFLHRDGLDERHLRYLGQNVT